MPSKINDEQQINTHTHIQKLSNGLWLKQCFNINLMKQMLNQILGFHSFHMAHYTQSYTTKKMVVLFYEKNKTKTQHERY